jgi:hypothetical protein
VCKTAARVEAFGSTRRSAKSEKGLETIQPLDEIV